MRASVWSLSAIEWHFKLGTSKSQVPNPESGVQTFGTSKFVQFAELV